MSKTDLSIPALGNKFIDLRDSLPGDSYTWSWERSLSEVNYLAIHHYTLGPDTHTPEEIANFHIKVNKWGGIGYHFLIAKDGTAFYVGDISTARANVANLNEQVIGICLIGNFSSGRSPTNEQLDSAHKLCDFFINNYPSLTNVSSWDKVRGHKELPGQTTICPGDNWDSWRIKIVEGSWSVEGERSSGLSSSENFVFNPPHQSLQSQVDSLQTSLSFVNQQVISLQETLQDREQEIIRLKSQLGGQPLVFDEQPKVDQTLTLVEALIKLYQSFERTVLPRESD